MCHIEIRNIGETGDIYATPLSNFLTLIIKQAKQKAKMNNAQGRIEPGSTKTELKSNCSIYYAMAPSN